MTTVARKVVLLPRGLLAEPARVAVAVLLAYAVGIGLYAAGGEHPAARAQIGAEFLRAGAGHSASIDRLRGLESSRVGYDGQFALYIALSPARAARYIDDPAYRYERIVYPMAARVVALGRPAAIPWTLILLNAAAAVGLTFFAAAYLCARSVSSWWALVLGASPGVAGAVAHDLNEPLAYALVAAGVLTLSTARANRVVLAGVAFGLAGLTRESTVLFPLAFGACLVAGVGETDRLGGRRLRDAVVLAGLGCGPILALKLALAAILAGSSVPEAVRPEFVPFAGLLERKPFGSPEIAQLVTVVLPSCLAVLLALVFVRRVCAPIVALVLNWLILVVFLPTKSYEHVLTSARISLGVPLAFLLCLPFLPARRRFVVGLAPAVYWMLAWL